MCVVFVCRACTVLACSNWLACLVNSLLNDAWREKSLRIQQHLLLVLLGNAELATTARELARWPCPAVEWVDLSLPKGRLLAYAWCLVLPAVLARPGQWCRAGVRLSSLAPCQLRCCVRTGTAGRRWGDWPLCPPGTAGVLQLLSQRFQTELGPDPTSIGVTSTDFGGMLFTLRGREWTNFALGHTRLAVTGRNEANTRSTALQTSFPRTHEVVCVTAGNSLQHQFFCKSLIVLPNFTFGCLQVTPSSALWLAPGENIWEAICFVPEAGTEPRWASFWFGF